MQRHARLLIAALTALALAGCGGSQSGGSQQQAADAPTANASTGTDAAVTFVADDVVYNEAPSTVPAGQVAVELVNQGSVPHDVVIEELAHQVVAHADGGQTVTGQISLEPGTYTYYCSIPGHRPAGMEGTFTVGG
jgi:plastocyanin